MSGVECRIGPGEVLPLHLRLGIFDEVLDGHAAVQVQVLQGGIGAEFVGRETGIQFLRLGVLGVGPGEVALVGQLPPFGHELDGGDLAWINGGVGRRRLRLGEVGIVGGGRDRTLGNGSFQAAGRDDAARCARASACPSR